MDRANWKERYKDKISTAHKAMKVLRPGETIFIGTGCGAPQHLVNAMVANAKNLTDTNIIQLFT
jgi:acyl-CoA hydrolase